MASCETSTLTMVSAMTRHKRPRVLHILEATLGGTMRYMENILSASASADIDYGFVYAKERADHRLTPMLEEAEMLGWELFPIEMCREIAPRNDVVSCLQLGAAIRRFRPDILHCHSSKAGALGRIASLTSFPRPRVIYSPHALADRRHHRLIEYSLKWITTAYVAVSESERDQIVSCGLADSGDVQVVYPVVDADHYSPMEACEARTRLQLPLRPIVLGIGRLTEQKDPLNFVKIVARLKEYVPDVYGLWVGDGKLRGGFLAEAERLGVADSIGLTGWQPDVRPYIAAADIMLSTSTFESFGYMVAEALSMERPVVATRVCGTVDILRDEFAANLYEAGDIDGAVTLLRGILADAKQAKQLAARGRLRIKTHFSKSRMEEKLQHYYRSLMRSSADGEPQLHAST